MCASNQWNRGWVSSCLNQGRGSHKCEKDERVGESWACDTPCGHPGNRPGICLSDCSPETPIPHTSFFIPAGTPPGPSTRPRPGTASRAAQRAPAGTLRPPESAGAGCGSRAHGDAWGRMEAHGEEGLFEYSSPEERNDDDAM